MNRRQFLCCSGYCGLSLALGDLISCAEVTRSPKAAALFGNIQIIDAHSHPDWDCQCDKHTPYNSTIAYMKELGMVASCFAAIGDQVYDRQGRLMGSEYSSTLIQLGSWKRMINAGKIKLVLKASDVPKAIGPESPPGAILSIEGGDPLEGKPERVDEFYRYGVRMITIVHNRNNDIGDAMQKPGSNSTPRNNGLTPTGRKIVERMQELGMVVDVAHSDSATLQQVAEMTVRPLLDSHTSHCGGNDAWRCGRLRRWKEMEMVAKTGGVVCTWPMSYRSGRIVRITFADWAREILEMKLRLGMMHVGLGTDGGPPSLPDYITGYRDIRDLTHLVTAMQEIGFSHDEIAAYMGGNLLRLLQSCIG
jgi:microsomal dipeptidase-like Zn-dependent dipeptidase